MSQLLVARVERAVEDVAQTLDDVKDQPAPVFLNEIMISVKRMEDLIKETRRVITKQVKDRNIQLQDFTLETYNVRSLEKPLDMVRDFTDKWGQLIPDLISADVLAVKLGKAEDLLKTLARNLGKIPEGVQPNDWVKAETARYMSPDTTETYALKSNTKKAKK